MEPVQQITVKKRKQEKMDPYFQIQSHIISMQFYMRWVAAHLKCHEVEQDIYAGVSFLRVFDKQVGHTKSMRLQQRNNNQ